MSFKKIYSLSLRESKNSSIILNVIMMWSNENEEKKHFLIVLNTYNTKNGHLIAKRSGWVALKLDDFRNLNQYFENFEEGLIDGPLNKRIHFKPLEKRKNYYELTLFRWHEPYTHRILLHRKQVDKINVNYDEILKIIHDCTIE